MRLTEPLEWFILRVPIRRRLTQVVTADLNRRPLFVSQTLFPLLAFTSLFAIAVSLCRAYDIPIPEAMNLLWTFGFSLLLTWWVRSDSRACQFHLPYEFGTFVFFAWPAVVPYYLYRSRGRKGLLFGVGICALYIVPYIDGVIVYTIKAMR
jgi:hypothetical protein